MLSVASNAVTLKQPLLQSWPAGAFVTPARTARLRVTQAVSRVTDAIATARLVFEIAGTTAIAKQDSTTTFNSTPVVDHAPESGARCRCRLSAAGRGAGFRDRHHGGG